MMSRVTTPEAAATNSCFAHGLRRRWRVGQGLLAGGVLLCVAGCAMRTHAVPVDPQVDFAAHEGHRGLVVDRAPGGDPAVLVTPGKLPFSSGPDYLLQDDGKTIAALWVKDPAHVTVRASADHSTPVIGRVQAHWIGGAINLTLDPANGPELHTGVFKRIDGPEYPKTLSSQATTVLDVRGMYEAELRDPSGAPVGWLRVRISPYMAASRIYDGDLPPSVQEPLATAAVALIDSDVDYIQGHTTDVYLGN
jgi:hypothetical protein